jgi:hypothetical protein
MRHGRRRVAAGRVLPVLSTKYAKGRRTCSLLRFYFYSKPLALQVHAAAGMLTAVLTKAKNKRCKPLMWTCL